MRKDKTPPASDEHRKLPGKKDTKKWCKGKVGREHVLVIVLDTRYSTPCSRSSWWAGGWMCQHVEACSTCGKVTRWFISKDECPAYNEA